MKGNHNPSESVQKVAQRLDVDFLLQATGIGVWELDMMTNKIVWDDRCRQLFGLTKNDEMSFEQVMQYIHPQDAEKVGQAVERATSPGSMGYYDQTCRTIGADDGQLRWVRLYGRSYFTEAGELSRFAGFAQEITSQIQTQQRLQDAQARQSYLLRLSDHLRSLKDPIQIQFEAACLLGEQLGANRVGYAETQPDNELVAVTRHYTQGVASIEGVYRYADYGLELLHRMQAGQTVVRPDIANDATLTDAQKEAHAVLQLGATLNVPLVKDGQLLAILFVHYPQAHAFSSDEVALVEDTAERIWAAIEQARAETLLRESEQRFRRLADTLPQAIWINDPEGNVEFLNQWWADYSGIPFTPTTAWQIARDIIHPDDGPMVAATFRRATELGTGFAIEQRNRSASGEYRWFFNTGVPYRDTETGPITKWVGCGVDIHDLKRAGQALQESQDRLQSIIELAQLGSYTIDLATDQITKSPQVAGWYGLPPLTDVATSLNAVAESDRAYVGQVYADAFQPGSSGAYQAEYTVINQQTGYRRMLRMIGQVIRNEEGHPVRVEGLVMDVTTQRAVQQALEQEVRQRTEELALANEELAVNNREYAAINKELEEANFLLQYSNENLQQFAYVASHDLQEPLRKIQQFGDLLNSRFGDIVGEEGARYIERMQQASSRMSTLIKELLAYSRLTIQRHSVETVDLAEVVSEAMANLELTIASSGAQIDVGTLPRLQGEHMALVQLFQNLLSNAIKFQQSSVPPLISVTAQTLPADALPSAIKLAQLATHYHCIRVADNGIGFDERYLDRIFQMFQRLHGKSEFPGTGIGLAICEKVVTNHGGGITASSQPGQGATFSVYLPA